MSNGSVSNVPTRPGIINDPWGGQGSQKMSLQDFILQLQNLGKAASPIVNQIPGMQGQPARQLTPAIVGGAPPQLAGGPPMQGAMTPGMGGMGGMMPTGGAPPPSVAQQFPQKGPESYPTPRPGGFETGFEFATKAGKNAAIVSGAISNIGQAVGKFKQQAFDKRRTAAEGYTTQIISMQKVINDPNTSPDVKKTYQQMMQQMMQDPKVIKVFEKMQDPTQPEHQGMRAAYEGANQAIFQDMQRQMQQKVLEEAGQKARVSAVEAQRAEAGKPSLDVEAQTKAVVEAARVRGQVPVKGEMMQRSDGTWVVPWYDKQSMEVIGYTPLEEGATPKSAVPVSKSSIEKLGPGGELIRSSTTTKGISPKGAAGVVGGGKLIGTGKVATDFKKASLLDIAALRLSRLGDSGLKGNTAQNAAYAHAVKMGLPIGVKPGQDALNRAVFAKQLTTDKDQQGQTKFEHTYALIDELDKKGKIGPLAGRMEKIGSWNIGMGEDADFDKLQANLELIAGAASRAHFGGRSGLQTFEKFDGMFARQRSAANMKGVLQELESTLKLYAQIAEPIITATPTQLNIQPGAPQTAQPTTSQKPPGW